MICVFGFVHVFHTLVPDSRSDRSKVSPAGTSMLSSTTVGHDLALALALAAELKVQELEARLTKLDTRVGAADARAAPRTTMDIIEERILKRLSDQQASKRV